MTRRAGLVVALACAAATAVVHVQAPAPVPAFSRTDLVKPPTVGWPTNGGNLGNQRYSPLAQINRDNVARLKGVWRTHLRGSGLGPQYSGEAQPLVYDGVIYIVTGADDVFAVAVETGNILWEYRANLESRIDSVCCGWTSRGVGLGDGKVFVGQLDGQLVALDQRTGKIAWAIQAERWQEGFTIPSAPLYYDGLIITGFAGAERGIRGRVKAYNAKDGSLAWTFYTIPGPGEPGHETWPKDNELWQDGGASVWHTPAVDPELGLLYFGTGNPGPDYNGLVRTGDNLYSVSTVALDAKTGKYRWHFQHVHHDIWDYDVATPPVLFDLTVNGQLRKGIAHPSKTGWVYILDRATGKPLVGIDERAVPQEPRQGTAATQPYPRGDAFVPQSIDIAPEGTTLVNKGRIFTPFWKTPVPVKPAIAGGANWAPAAYDAQAGHLFVCASDRAVSYVVEELEPQRPREGANYVGGSPIRLLPLLGVFAALDVRTNKLVWQQQWPDQCFSGVAVTAGGLAFVGRNDGRLTALDTSNGMRLWEFQTGAGMNSPVSIFQHNGRQYVVAYSAGNMLQGTARGDSLWLFGLDGTLDPAAPSAAATAVTPAAAGQPNLYNLDSGKATFDRACASCHGPQGEGGHDGGPSLRRALTAALVMQTVSEGRREMPSFSSLLTAEQIRDVAAYVSQRLSQTASRTLIRHDFTDSAQGWIVRGDTRPADAIFNRTGGHPGGCITGVDEALGETWYFLAPGAVLQQLPQAVNGTLSYSLKQSAPLISLFDDDVVIVGPAGRLSYRFPRAPGTEWTDFAVRLSASEGWTWNWNERATQARIAQVLAAPTLLQIRGEYATGDDTGSLDNFELKAGGP